MNSLTCTFLFLLFCASLCQNCTANNERDCKRCQNYYFFDGKCQPCNKATGEYACELCKGFYFRQNKCLQCSQLTNPGMCQECRGYYFADGKCTPCEIASTYMCTLQCPDYFLKRGTCTHCSQASDNITCKYCNSAFEFKGGKCLQCPKHYTTNLLDYECMSCTGINNKILCSSCEEHYFANSTCQHCKTALTIAACSICPQFFFNGSICKHCNEAAQMECSSCKNHLFINGFCVPCRLLSNDSTCSSCSMFRYSTDRQMCVPCQMKGYFLNANNTCEHCLNAKTEQTCKYCPRFTFDRKNKECLNCSEIVDASKCSNCLDFYYSTQTLKCISCLNASMLECLLQCPGHFYKKSCTRCAEAQNLYDCKTCGSQYFWSSSGKCQECTSLDFYVKGNECLHCSMATTAIECSFCDFYFFRGGKCMPCRSANSSLECSNCQSVKFYFNSNNVCQLCSFASEGDCNRENCPGFGYWNGSCKAVKSITSEAACIKFQDFTYTLQGCRYCVKTNEYLNPTTNLCFKCESIKNATECEKCSSYYFDKEKSSCSSCATIKNRTLCSLCTSHIFLVSNQCVPCSNLTKRSDCNQCSGYIYIKGECTKCTFASSIGECSTCQNYGFENQECKRCEAITDMDNCEKYCSPQGYFPVRTLGICLSCAFADNQGACLFCRNYTWNATTNRCVSCNQSAGACQQCGGMYWSGACKPCMSSGCNKCGGDGKTCLSCKPSFILAVNNLTCTKVCNAKYCSKCADNSSQICQICQSDYDFQASKGLCRLRCILAGCSICISNSVCSVCNDGYILKQNGEVCMCSIENCDSCYMDFNSTIASNSTTFITTASKSVKCRRCLIGYNYNTAQNICSKIECQIDNCRLCKNTSACQSCDQGWKITSNKCVQICSISGCRKCSSMNTCQICVKGYLMRSQTQCEPFCNISNCLRCKSSTQCQKCPDGYSVSNDSTKCLMKCPIGLYERNGGCLTCSKSIQNCQKCTYANQALVCSKCQSSYTSSNGQCASCNFLSPNCNRCNNNGKRFQCLSCSFGYSLIAGRCRKCADNCQLCDKAGDDDCDVCITGYVYNSESLNQIKCIPCLNNCAACAQYNISTCYECHQGSYLLDGRCLKCSSNCKTCGDESTCFQCQAGYFLDNQACFLKRIPECKLQLAIGNATRCIMCNIGYDINGNDECSPSNCSLSASCQKCQRRKYLSSGRCLDCPAFRNCLRCSESGEHECISCENGYYLQGNSQCKKCSAGCSNCMSNYQCTTAAVGFYLDKGNSLPAKCPNECATCKNPYSCQSCYQGFNLYKVKCISAEALRLNVTVKPLNKGWDNLTNDKRFQSLLQNWAFYQAELLKLIGYENRQELVFVDEVVTGSITYSLVIDKLPTELTSKVAEHIEQSMKRQSKTLKVISYSNVKESPKVEQGKSQSTQSCTLNYAIVAFIALSSAALCIAAYFFIRRYLRNRIAPQSQSPQEIPSNNTGKFINGKDKENHSSDDGTSKDGESKNNQEKGSHFQIQSQITK